MSVTLRIKIQGDQVGQDIAVPYRAGMNVQQLLEAAYDSQPKLQNTLRFAATYFGSALGYELTALDGIVPQSGADLETFFFWELLIDGKYSQHGMDQSFPQDGDAVEWDYTMYVNERHAGTRHEQIRDLLVGS